MTKQYFLRFLIRNQANDLVFEVPKNESDRLSKILMDDSVFDTQVRFFWFDTADGKSVIINLADVQAVRFLWEGLAVTPATELSAESDESLIYISLRGRAEILEEFTEDPDQLYDLFKSLEYGPDVIAYPSFDDVDGEPLQLNSREVVWIIAPTNLIDEGARIIAIEDGLENGK